MSSLLPVLCIYDGELVMSKDNYEYKGGASKSFMLSSSATYNELIQKIYHSTKTSKEGYEISVKVIYPSSIPCPLVDILDDDDVAAFIAHNIRNVNNTNIPLLVTRVKTLVPMSSSQPTTKRNLPQIPLEEALDHRKFPRVSSLVKTKDLFVSSINSIHVSTADIATTSKKIQVVPCASNIESNRQIHVQESKVVDNDIRCLTKCPIRKPFIDDDILYGKSVIDCTLDINACPTPDLREWQGADHSPNQEMVEVDVEPTDSGDGCDVLNALLNTTPKKSDTPNHQRTHDQQRTFHPTYSRQVDEYLAEVHNNTIYDWDLIDKCIVNHSDTKSTPNHLTNLPVHLSSSFRSPLTNPKKDMGNQSNVQKATWVMKVKKEECMLDFEDTYVNKEYAIQIDTKVDCRNIELHQMFKDKKSMIQFLNKYALLANIEYKVLKSSTTRYTIKCKRENCPWRLHASRIKGTEVFQIKTLVAPHGCSLPQRGVNHQQATSKLISDFVISKLQAHVLYTPKAIICDVQKEFGVTISYKKAWKAREIAIMAVRGSYEESYALLPAYCHELRKKNPGTITTIQREGDRFLRFFLALGQCIRSVRNQCLRPVIAVDGSFLKGKYKGTLFLATTMDGDNHIFPIALGIGESENNDSWNWFLTQLRDAIGHINDLVILSDRHQALLSQVPKVFPYAFHGYCAFHISQNMHARFKQPLLYKYFYSAAKATRMTKFLEFMGIIRDINRDAYEWLNEIEKERWTSAFFPRRRYNIITTNSAESYNSVLKEVREYPITMLVEEFRLKIQGLWFKRRKVAADLTTKLTKWAEEELEKDMKEARGTACFPINFNEYSVRSLDYNDHVVLNMGRCTCRKFDVMFMPCAHALAGIAQYSMDPYSFCTQYYHAENYRLTYEELIYPVTDKSQWETPEELLRYDKLLPPRMRILAGRPKKNRILSQGEERKTVKCGRCKCNGHNRKTCKFPIPHEG